MYTSWKAWSPFVGARFSWALVMSPWFSGPGWPSLCSSMQKYLGYKPSAVHGSPYLLVRPVITPFHCSSSCLPQSSNRSLNTFFPFLIFVSYSLSPSPSHPTFPTSSMPVSRCPQNMRGAGADPCKGASCRGGIVLNLTPPLWSTEKSITKLFIPSSSVNSFPPKPGAIFLIHEHYRISQCFLWCVLQHRMPFLFPQRCLPGLNLEQNDSLFL